MPARARTRTGGAAALVRGREVAHHTDGDATRHTNDMRYNTILQGLHEGGVFYHGVVVFTFANRPNLYYYASPRSQNKSGFF